MWEICCLGLALPGGFSVFVKNVHLFSSEVLEFDQLLFNFNFNFSHPQQPAEQFQHVWDRDLLKYDVPLPIGNIV